VNSARIYVASRIVVWRLAIAFDRRRANLLRREGVLDITAGLQAVGTALDIARGLRALDKSWDQVQLKGQIIDLTDALVDAKSALVEAREAMAAKDKQIGELLSAFREWTALVSGRDGYKYRADPAGGPDGYPACPTCESVSGRVVFLLPDGYWRNGKCPACHNKFSPIQPYNSEGEREEMAENARNRALMDQGRSHNTGY